jgi:hypothetical protein
MSEHPQPNHLHQQPLTYIQKPSNSLCRSLCGGQQPDRIAVTRPGLFEAVPDLRLSLQAPQAQVLAALTGPDGGVTALKRKLAGVATA